MADPRAQLLFLEDPLFPYLLALVSDIHNELESCVPSPSSPSPPSSAVSGSPRVDSSAITSIDLETLLNTEFGVAALREEAGKVVRDFIRMLRLERALITDVFDDAQTFHRQFE